MSQAADPLKTPLDQIPALGFHVRVKLPPAGNYHRDIKGDLTDVELAYQRAIFAVKPPGFEVCWPRPTQQWPVDSEGYTYVPLYLTSHKDALAYHIDQHGKLRMQLRDLRSVAEDLINKLRNI